MNTIDFDKIRQQNEVDYGKGKGLEQFKDFYKDRTHFIFELLQNAEDTGAKKVLFKLFDDRLEFHHNGRVFDEEDVIGICNIGEGTKRKNLDKIGKFGLGFKSVYCYTNEPEIYSNNIAFKIKKFVFPYEINSNIKSKKNKETIIILPFKEEKDEDDAIIVSPQIAVQEIEKALSQLDIHTMLFLQHIQEIEYILPDGKKGFYKQDKKILEKDFLRKINIIGENHLGEEQEKNYFIFQRSVPTVKDPQQTVSVEIAFQWQPETTDKNNNVIAEKLIPEYNTKHFVTFATEQETGLNFIIQCNRYNTTPSRETIKNNNEWNDKLIAETAELLGDILPKIKQMGLLSVDFLNTLPIKKIYEYNLLYRPLAEKTLELLQTGEYLPTNDGKFISSEKAVLAYAQDLTELLSSQQLTQLLKSEKYWITREITENKQETKNLYTYLKRLGIEEFSRNNLKDNLDEKFLSKQSDDWLNKFYKHLGDYSPFALEPFKTLPIIRCEDGQMSPVCDDKGEVLVFLPTEGISYFPTVKRSIYNENKDFFKSSLNLKTPDINDEIQRLLNFYNENNLLSPKDNQQDIQKIISEWDNLNINIQEKVKKTKLLLVQENKEYQSPENVYYPTEELKIYFNFINDSSVFLDIDNYNSIVENDFLKIGVRNIPKLVPYKRDFWDYKNNTNLELNPKPEKMQGKEPYNFDDWDKLEFYIYGLNEFIKNLNIDNIRLLWKIIIECNNNMINNSRNKGIFKGYIRWQYGRNSKICYHNSIVFETLQKTSCIPDKNDDLHLPKDIIRDDIADWFIDEFMEPNKDLFDSFPLKNNCKQLVIKLLCNEYGLKYDNANVDIDQYIKQKQQEKELKEKNYDKWQELQELEQEFEEKKQKLLTDYEDDFPNSPVHNPERLTGKTEERIKNTSSVGSRTTERTVSTNRADKENVREFLKTEYQNDEKEIICQICKDTMPFKKKNGEYYFETTPIFQNVSKDDKTNYLALCPTCAAIYGEYITHGDGKQLEQIKQAISQQDSGKKNEISIIFQFPDTQPQKTTIRFTERHFFNLKIVLTQLGIKIK